MDNLAPIPSLQEINKSCQDLEEAVGYLFLILRDFSFVSEEISSFPELNCSILQGVSSCLLFDCRSNSFWKHSTTFWKVWACGRYPQKRKVNMSLYLVEQRKDIQNVSSSSDSPQLFFLIHLSRILTVWNNWVTQRPFTMRDICQRWTLITQMSTELAKRISASKSSSFVSVLELIRRILSPRSRIIVLPQ